MTDRDALLRAILLNPADDAPRLVYADWLDEHANDGRPCHECQDGKEKLWGRKWECRYCDGTDRVPNGNADRAEFIRVQCELARDDADDVANGRMGTNPLRERERELWGYLPTRGGVLQKLSDALPSWAVLLGDDEGKGLTNNYPWAIVRRGFVASVRAPLAVLFGGDECPSCGGRGHHGMDPGRVAKPCQRCDGSGRTPGIAAALFSAQPVEAVRLTDREPVQNDDQFAWYSDMASGTASLSEDHFRLPHKLWKLLGGYQDNGLNGRHYDSADAAHAALSRACVAHGRQLAGLPPLPANPPGLGAVRPPA